MSGAADAMARFFLPDLVQEHLDEAAFLWTQRTAALRSIDYTLLDFAHLEGRLQAHMQGLTTVGEDAHALLEEAAASGEGAHAFAGGLALLITGGASRPKQVFDAFLEADGERLAGLRDALCHGPAPALQPMYGPLVAEAPGPIAAAAAEILAFQSPHDRRWAQPLDRLLRHESPDVRRAGWRIAGLLALPVQRAAYDAAAADDDAAVRREVALAAALARAPWLLERAIRAAARPGPADVEVLSVAAIVAAPGEAQQLAGVARAVSMGPARFHILALLGHPQSVPGMLSAMDHADPAIAAAAGAAFAAITGKSVASGKRAPIVPTGPAPDAFDQEFLDEAMLPDPALARNWWVQNEARFRGGGRWCRGIEVDGPTTPHPEMDMAAHWEAMVRNHFHGARGSDAIAWERFPRPVLGAGPG